MGFRSAHDQEDDELGVVLYNAFLPVWNHNWFQGIKEPIPQAESLEHLKTLPSLSQNRYAFYRSLIRAVRLLEGEVLVNESNDEPKIQAVLLWLPPYARLTFSKIGILLSSGMFTAMLKYGAGGIYRVNVTFEGNIEKLFKKAKVDAEASAFVQMLASNPKCAGKRAASRLLEWRVNQHFEQSPTIPVVLDTTTDQAIRAYEALQFKVIGSIDVDSGTDKDGFKLSSDASPEAKAEAKRLHVQRVMIRAPAA